jgi:glutamyl-tRNA synthetase
VDDIDMAITHVIRGDDHVNNTPRQINIFRALGKEPPVYAHLPTVLNEQGEKMSKRHGAKPVTWYRDEGFLPEAMINYLARLGWSHGDDELFSREQFLSWFNLDHLGKSAAQFDEAKLRWVNAQHIKRSDDAVLAMLAKQQLESRGVDLSSRGAEVDAHLTGVAAVFKDRCETIVQLADWAECFYAHPPLKEDEAAKHLTDAALPAVSMLAKMLEGCPWTREAITEAIKETLRATGLKMPQLAMPVRVLVMGTAQTPSLDAVLSLCTREQVLMRLAKAQKFAL